MDNFKIQCFDLFLCFDPVRWALKEPIKCCFQNLVKLNYSYYTLCRMQNLFVDKSDVTVMIVVI